MKEKIVRLKTNMGSWQRGERRRRSWKWLEVDGGDGSNQLSWRRKPQSVQQLACTSHTASRRSSPSSSSNSFTHYSHTIIFNLHFLFLIFSPTPSKKLKINMGEKLESYQKAKSGLHVPTQQKIAEKKSSMPLHVRRRHQLLRRIEDQSIINKKTVLQTPEKMGGERDGAWRELLLFNIFFLTWRFIRV